MRNLVIAEVGSVHDGSFGNATKLIELAAQLGADVVKFQTHLAEAESLASAPAPAYFTKESRLDYFKRTGFSTSQWKELANHARACGIMFMSSPFSLEAVDLLEEVGNSIYKIPSGEVTNTPLLEKIAGLRKPVLLSSGMSDWAELDQAVEILKRCGDLTVMQCSSIYPCPPEKVGLNILTEMRARYGVGVGLSDHTLGFAAPLAAAALGASVIEKHLTFSRLMYGSDAAHSMEPQDFRSLTMMLREVWTMRDHPVDKNDLGEYKNMKVIFQKSLVASSDIPAGTVLTPTLLAYKKPGDGIPAARYSEFVGRRVNRPIAKDTMLFEADFS